MEKTREEAEFSIPLQKISFEADVTGMFAQVSCEQEFENQNEVPVEAVYVFPLPEDASIAGCVLIIGDKRIEAELKEKEQAKQEYDDAVAAGHHASLLEQRRDNIFAINVGGIEPGENIKIVTTYNQRVPWQDNGGRFNVPLVVAPRFVPGVPSGTKTGGGWAEDTDEVPDASEVTPVVAEEGVTYTADITVTLSPGFKCQVSSPSHEMVESLVKENSGKKTRYDVIDLEIDEPAKPITIEIKDLVPDRDFIVLYQTKSHQVGTAVHQGYFDGEGYITVDVIPPDVTSPKTKDVIFCLDISGSMAGPKLEGLKVVAEKVAKRLSEQNSESRVGIVAFETDIHPIMPLSGVSATTYEKIQGLEDQGGTYAGKALDYCFQQLAAESSREKYILLVSDGETYDRWSSVAPGVRVISVGIGTAVDMAYLKDIARETKGVSLAVYPGEDYDTVASTLVGYLAGPVLTDIEVTAEGKTFTDVQGITDVYTSMPASLALKIADPEINWPENIQLTGTNSEGKKSVLILDVQDAGECLFAHQIWAREKLRDQDLSKEDLIALSLEYSVLCKVTAFVAVHLKDVPGAKPERIEIPVALPHTWDYDKIFGRGGEVPIGGLISGRLISGHGLVSHASYTQQALPDSGGYRPPGIYPETLMESSLEMGEPSTTAIPPKGPAGSSASSSSGASSSSESYTGEGAKAVPVVDSLEDLIDRLEEGSIERAGAEALWQSLEKQLTKENIESWPIDQKAEAFYYLLKLRAFGFHAAKETLQVLSIKPDPSATSAYWWWEEAQKVLGVAVGAVH